MDQSTEMLGSIIDGKKLALEVRQEVFQRIQTMNEAGQRPPCLAILLVGDDSASQIYVRNKSRVCERLGIDFVDVKLPATTSGPELIERVNGLNRDPGVDGILVQLPLPDALRDFEAQVLETIDPGKDVDGLHPENVGKLHLGRPGFVPCTPLGILEMLDRTGTPIAGARAVVVGRSDIVGKPVAALLLQRHATVSICHSRTRDLEREVAQADILIAAVGRAHLIKGDWIKPGAVVIDVGINRTGDGILGDVEFEGALRRAAHITPVPGGVGPMTIAMLMKSVLRARLARNG